MRLQEGGVVWWPHWQLSKPLQHAIHMSSSWGSTTSYSVPACQAASADHSWSL